MYKIEELRAKDRNELLQLISELKGKLLALRFESATGQLNETHLPNATKKDIARIFTVLKEKELGIEIEAKEKVFTPKAEVKTETPKVEEVKEEATPSVQEAEKVEEEATPSVQEAEKVEETTTNPEEEAK